MSHSVFITNISWLAVTTPGVNLLRGREMASVPGITNAFLWIKDGLIHSFGSMENVPNHDGEIIDAKGGIVLPGFIDSHSHLVFPSSREKEFVLKIKGASYADIAQAGGGILNSAHSMQGITEDELLEISLLRLNELIKKGTVAIEIKSGYGLNTNTELKMLRVARKLGEYTGIPVKTTFLGAHAVPGGMTKKDYLKLVVEEMIPAVSSEGLADFIDVFCEEGFFNPQESLQVLEAGKNAGMIPRLHANQLGHSGGVDVAITSSAASADHLEYLNDQEIEKLFHSQVIPVALPGAAFFLRLPFTPARKLLDAGLPLVVASDYNPGSSPSGNMMMMWSLACIGMRMTPEEGLNAITINPAVLLGLHHSHGSIAVGKAGSVIITRQIPSLAYLPYHYAMDSIEKVIVSGKIISSK